MNIIDFHTHIFPDNLAERAIQKIRSNSQESVNHTDGTTAGLQKSMNSCGITHSVILSIATKVSQVRIINESSAQLKSQSFIPFGTLHPLMENVAEEIAFLKKNEIKGIKLHPEYQDFYIDEPRFFAIYEQLTAENIILLLHAGKDPGPFSCDHATPEKIRHISRLFPKLTMIAAHFGGWKMWNEVEEILCGLPIYFDTSAINHLMPPEQFVRIALKHGIDRILFGTDSPWFDQCATLEWHRRLPLSDEEKAMILGLNASRLLGII